MRNPVRHPMENTTRNGRSVILLVFSILIRIVMLMCLSMLVAFHVSALKVFVVMAGPHAHTDTLIGVRRMQHMQRSAHAARMN